MYYFLSVNMCAFVCVCVVGVYGVKYVCVACAVLVNCICVHVSCHVSILVVMLMVLLFLLLHVTILRITCFYVICEYVSIFV